MGQAVLRGPEPPRASEAEMRLIRDHFGLEAMSSDDREKILRIDAYRWTDSEPFELAAFLWLRPIFAQGAICIAHEFASLGRPGAQGYAWTDQERYHHWLGQSEIECALGSSDQLPQSVVTWEPIATAAMIQILEAEEELVERTLDQSDPEVIGDLSGNWRLERISFSRLDPELGISYQATFRRSGRERGPSCTFTIVGGEIQILSVGYWVA
jgi:hypothetical protein